MFITRHTRLSDASLRDRLWDLYSRCFAQQQVQPFDQVVTRTEFDEVLLTSTNRVWVVWDDQRPVVMTVIATDISSTRWLNPEYFRRHHPDRMRTRRVHYVLWVIVDPHVEIRGANIALAKEALTYEARDGALLVFDVPAEGEHRGDSAAHMMLRMANMVAEVELLPLATQQYFALDFRASDAKSSSGDGDSMREVMSIPTT
jgi:hypothetical protein